jgi:inositol phosphorylceramide mannosyltransferase catalytic subunit
MRLASAGALRHFRRPQGRRIAADDGGMAPSVPPGEPTPVTLLIPRTFHRIWFGGAMPAEFERYGATWREHHPDWEMVTWTEDTLPPLRNQAAFDAAPSMAQKADIARYELLLRFGGVYIDCDFECLRSIEPLIAGVEAFAAREDDHFVNVAIMGAVPGHPLFTAAVEEIPGRIAALPHAGVNEQTGPHLLTALVQAHGEGTPQLTVFGPPEFYPYKFDEMHRRGEAFPTAYGVHHWAHSWAEPTVHRFALPVDMDRPEQAAVPMALFAELFGAYDPVELALVIDGDLTPEVGARLGALAETVGVAGGPEIVAYAPDEVAALSLAGTLGPDPADAARAVARLLALR